MATTTPTSDLSDKLRAAIEKQFPTAEWVEKKSYERISLARENGSRPLTLGYYYGSSHGKPAVETADGKGGWTYHRVHKASDIRPAVTAMRNIVAAAAKKAKAKK